jgi:hypothetical protein
VPTRRAAGRGADVPRSLPDRAQHVHRLHYSLRSCPSSRWRRARPTARGLLHHRRQDFSDDLARTPRVRYVNRWRLEKKDPAAALSEPVKPITFWLDRTIP